MTQPSTGYTSDEISAVVQQLVLSSITTPLDTLGVRRSDLTFNQFQQTAAGLFVLYPNAPFYVLWLGVQRIRDQVTAEAVIIQQLLAAIAATGMKVTPVSDVSPLFNAQSALQNLAAAAANRTSAIGKVSNAPAYQQFSANVATFLGGAGQNVKSNGQIVQTPQQAKAAIPGLVTQLQQAHAALVASVTLIVNGVDNYNSISLPAIVSESVLSSAASLIGSSAKLLNSLSPTDRLTEVRQVVLNLIASKTAVDTFGTLNQPSDYYTLAGVGMPYSDAQHLATPAMAVGDQTGAMAIITGLSDLLLLVLDGDTTVPITLPPSVIAELDGQGSDLNFYVLATVASPNVAQNNSFKMKINSTSYTCPLTLSTVGPPAVARTADQVAADINAVIPTGQVQAQGYYSPLKYSGKLITDGAGTTWTVPSYGSPPAYIANLFALNVSPGDTIEYSGSFYVIATVDPAGTFVTTTTAGPISSTVAVQIGPVNRKLKIICVDPDEQVAAGTSITVYADDAASTGALQMLGFTSGMTMSCAPTTPDVVASYINANTSLVEAGTYISSLYVGSAEGSTTSSTTIVLTEAEASGSQMFVGPGTDLTYTVTGLVTGGLINTGDTMAVRSGPTPASYYVISEINGQTDVTGHTLAVGDIVLGVLGAGSPVGAGSATNVDVQFGPTLTLSKYDCITVQGPNVNQGLYLVASQGGTGLTPLDVALQSALSAPAAGSVPSTFTISYGKRSLTLASLNTTTTSEVFVGGNAAGLFFLAAVSNGLVNGTATFLGTTITWTVTAITDAGNISVGNTLDTQNTSSGSSACYIVQSINGDSMATNHPLTVGDVIVANGTIGGPVDSFCHLLLLHHTARHDAVVPAPCHPERAQRRRHHGDVRHAVQQPDGELRHRAGHLRPQGHRDLPRDCRWNNVDVHPSARALRAASRGHRQRLHPRAGTHASVAQRHHTAGALLHEHERGHQPAAHERQPDGGSGGHRDSRGEQALVLPPGSSGHGDERATCSGHRHHAGRLRRRGRERHRHAHHELHEPRQRPSGRHPALWGLRDLLRPHHGWSELRRGYAGGHARGGDAGPAREQGEPPRAAERRHPEHLGLGRSGVPCERSTRSSWGRCAGDS